MSLEDVIKAIDEADLEIRQKLRLSGIPLREREALEKARNLLQQALTPLLTYQV